jgi:hypothetical protein
MPDFIAELTECVEEEDERTRADRVERAAWVLSLGWSENGYLLFGGHGSLAPWDELRQAFINGEFVATILVGQAFMEQTLAGYLDLAGGSSVGRSGLAEILEQFRDRGWINETEFNVLDEVRRLRNPYAHYRDVQHKDNLGRRIMAEREDYTVLIERDARSVVRALMHLLNRHPFAMGPIVFPEDDGPFVHPDQTALPV